MKRLILIALFIQACGQQGLNNSTSNSQGPCAGSQTGTWSNIAVNNTLTLNASCSGTTTYCNEAFTYVSINSSTYQLTVSQTNGGPECLPIGQTNCTGGFIGDVLWLNCGAGKNLNSNYNRL